MAEIKTVRLNRSDSQPWGFRLQGGRDYGVDLSVLKVICGSIAERAGLMAGDLICKINNIDVFHMTHKEAQDLIVRSGNNIDIQIQRGPTTLWRPTVTPTGPLPTSVGNNSGLVTRTSLAHKPQVVSHIGCGYNNAARPFVNGRDGQLKSIMNAQHNTPIGLYSDEAIAETLSAQAEVLAGGVLGVNFKKNEKVYNAANSEVYKFLQEQEHDPHEPADKSHTVVHSPSQQPPHYQQQQQQNSALPSVTRHVIAPVIQPKPPGLGGVSSTKQNLCSECERLIVGVFVRIKDKNLHVDCFKCATCGTSLKNQGYFNLNNKLYCDIHAKLAAMQNPPAGTEGYLPVPIKPGTKLSASTITAALNAHHLHQANGGTTHLITSPTSNTTNYSSPKPFGPPVSSQKSPTSYPPQHQQQQQQQQQYQQTNWSQSSSKPATNPYATLPRSTGPTQGRFNTYKPGIINNFNRECLEQTSEYSSVRENQYQQQQQREEHHYEDIEVETATRGQISSFIWPPPVDEDRCTPTASPLYIAPPETQKVVPKPIQRKDQQQIQQQQQQQISEQQQYLQMQSTQEQYQNQIEQQQQQQHWQSRSAPELTTGRQLELESGSDSYTSTCTTTTTTSEEYQKMYQAQMQAYQMQQMYDQSGSEIDYHMDMEVAAVQQQQQHEQSYSNLSFLSTQSGRRSVQECAELISGPVSTYKLVDLVREVTPSPEVPVHKGPRRVEFADEQSKEISSCQQSESIKCQETKKMNTEIKSKMEKEEQIVKEVKEVKEVTENKCQIEQRKFQPTPEIKIEIPEAKPIPPTNIPNPVPKEWISPMVKALTTAPDKPVEISEVRHCESPCGAEECEAICMKSKKNLIEKTNTKADNKEKRIEPEVLKESPPEGSFITKVMTTAPDEKVKFTPKSSDIISLPEETEPYMPPPIDKKPYIREDYRPKSPLLSALTTAPETPYSPFGHDVMSQLNDLPTPKSKLTMKDALTVAPERCYTPLSSENTLNLQSDENKQNKLFSEHKMKIETAQNTKQNIETHMNQQISAFKSTQDTKVQLNQVPSISQNSLTVDRSLNQESQFSAHRDSFAMNNARQSAFTHHVSQQQERQQETYQASSVQSSSYKCMNQSQMQSKTHHTCSSTTAAKQISYLKSECQQKSQDAEQKVVFPPPSPIPTPTSKKAIVSGLHKPDKIPQYQRNWTVLPSQRPVRTPEPQELKENVPLAFVEVPKERSPSVQRQINPETTTNSTSSDTKRKSNETKSQSSVPIIIEDRSGPITMTFQSIDDQKEDHSQAHPRPFTPSLINKPAPIIPFYQTPQKLVFEECQPAKAQPFDRRSASPLPDRAKSPAPGPPPNPLSAIRAPRIREEDNAGYRNLQVGSITTGQSYYASQAMQKQQQQQGQMTSHYQTTSAYGSQKFTDKPEIVQQKKIGDTTIQTREKESRLDEEQRRELQSKTTTQIGNTQIERRRKVVEEYEHTQSAKTIEIQKSSGSTVQQTRQQYGKTGFVANQARRLSNLEQEISNISSQSQAISARAAKLGSESPSRFPFFKSPEPVSKFPIKPDVSPYDESRNQTYVVSADTSKKLLDPPPGFQKQQSHKQKQATISSQYSSYDASSVAQSSSATQSLLAASSNQSSLSSASNLTTAIPVPAFKPPVGGNSDTLCGKASLQQPTSNNNTYKPTPSTGPAGFKPPQQPAPQISSNTNPSVVVSDPSPASAGSNKGGAFGATSAPKRGRGILNKAVGPGVRVPHCGCCNTQIRGPFITALGRIWCPDHFVCVNANCRRALQDIGFVEEKGDLYCEYCFEKYLAPTCSKCNAKIKGDCLNAIGKHFHPECFTCAYCGKIFGNTPFFMEEGEPYCEADWNELFTTKCFACGFPVEAGDRWVEALNHNYHSQCFNCTLCKKNLEGQSFYNKGGRPFCKNHAR